MPPLRGVKPLTRQPAEQASLRITEVGPQQWLKMHSDPTGSPQLLAEVKAALRPILGCGCGWAFDRLLQRLPPVYGAGWFRRTWEWHEEVNRELGKPGMSFEDAAVRWGRCDLIEQPTTAV
jgi:hypothetical protein